MLPKMKWNVPNVLTLLRMVMIPAFIIVFFWDYPHNLVWAAVIFVLAGLTDYLDGSIARRKKLVSDWGKLFDPLADKLMQVSVFVCLYIGGIVPIWFVLLFAAKELLMIAGSMFILKRKSKVVMANLYGKLATVIFYMVAVLLLLLNERMPGWLTVTLLVTAFLFTVLAMVMYIFEYISSDRTKEKLRDQAVIGVILPAGAKGPSIKDGGAGKDETVEKGE